jgi:hypothetical protein
LPYLLYIKGCHSNFVKHRPRAKQADRGDKHSKEIKHFAFFILHPLLILTSISPSIVSIAMSVSNQTVRGINVLNVLTAQTSSASTVVNDVSPVTSKSAPPLSSHTLKKRPWRPYITPFDSLVAAKYPGSGTMEDPYIIDWIQHDPEDPQRWSSVWKWFTILVVSFTTLAVALASSAYSGGIRSLQAEFGASQELLVAGISLFVVGFAFGPL